MKIVIEKILSAEQEAEVDERFTEADKYGSRFFSNIRKRRMDLAKKNMALYQKAMIEFYHWKLTQGHISELEYLDGLLRLKQHLEDMLMVMAKYRP